MFENEAEAQGSRDTETEQIQRKSKRSTKGIPAKRYGIEEVSEVTEVRTLEEALSSKQKEEWQKAMEEEIASLEKHCTWELIDLPKGRTPVGCKWVYKLKKDSDGNIVRFKARLVAKGYSQKYGQGIRSCCQASNNKSLPVSDWLFENVCQTSRRQNGISKRQP